MMILRQAWTLIFVWNPLDEAIHIINNIDIKANDVISSLRIQISGWQTGDNLNQYVGGDDASRDLGDLLADYLPFYTASCCHRCTFWRCMDAQ